MTLWTRDPWLFISAKDLAIERRQCRDEGKDISAFEAEFDTLIGLGDELAQRMDLQARAGKLLDRTARLRPAKGFAFREPSDLAGIQKARRRRVKLPAPPPGDDALREKALGAWLGRCAGCTLGKPVEGRLSGEIEGYLRAQGRWPLDGYFSGQADEEVRTRFRFRPASHPCYVENLTRMVEDDDTNYTVAGLGIVQWRGKTFTPADVARFWMGNIPILHACTAERVAYRNLVSLVPPPGPDGKVDGRFSSATYRNPHREWIGAQIRADFFGYVNPADPQTAADFAWRDACISHVKNGIYGEMWVAAMLAAAYVIDRDAEKVIRAGLGEIPHRSRLHADVSQVLDWRAEGLDYAQAVQRLRSRWDETDPHHWCHTNSNAMVVAIALLWGELDLGRTLCYAVMPGFDTDCNGATAGSVLGMMLGGGRLPEEWIGPLNDTLESGVAGFHEVKLSDMARRTVELIHAMRQ